MTHVKNYELRKNPDLRTILPEYPGNTFYHGRYKSDEPRVMPSWKNILKWFFSINPQHKEKKRDTFKVKVIENTDIFHQTNDQMVWLGHASFLIKLDGKLLLTDPCLRNLPFKRRKVGLPFPIETLSNIDYILLSHAHRDHLDLPSLKKLIKQNPGVQILTALDIAKLLPKQWKPKIQEAGWYQIYNDTASLKISFLPAQHWNRRFFTDTDRQLWGSFLIQSKDTSIYFAGDTAFGQHFDKIRFLNTKIDHCLLPVGAYMPRYVMKGVHLNPQEAILAFKILGAKNFIPMHYGTYNLSDEPAGEPIRIIKEAQNRSIFSGNFKPLDIGETYPL